MKKFYNNQWHLGVLFCVGTVFLLPVSASAGTLVLINGDSLSGELHSVDLANIHWHSPMLGKIKIPKRNVRSVDTKHAFKLRGSRKPCKWETIRDDSVVFECQSDGQVTIPLLSIAELTQFEAHQNSLHSYRGKLSLLGSKETGNRVRQDWIADANVTLRFSDFRHDIDLLYELRSSNGRDPSKEAEIAYSFDWFFKPRWFWFSDVTLSEEEPKDIKLRSAIASGVGYQFWEKKRSALSIDFGIDFTDEVYFEGVNENLDESNASWRFSTDYRYLLPMAVEFSHRNQILLSTNESQTWELESQTRLRVPIGQSISANVRFDYDYDNDPVEGNVKNDSALRFGIGYAW